ncbi:ATP-binding protein [Phyllobacterium chamaecytisi]|uniref:ATP-binding protein n=1 Tax=Phyllobacterium chamaecytisi TaxID=2876082 RepID=UPI001CCDE453|nr:winged helix-turn-helix domain-containing protein [Phyllobacterium sp. KW56]MBZ9601402.1 helix-turn-helix transcriptional regulator [Phyllobacterium sp. KW56]
MSVRLVSQEDARLFGPFRFVKAQRSLTREGIPVLIGGRALDVLGVLLDNPGSVVSGRHLIEQVWKGVTVEDANLRTQLTALRKALGDGINGSRYIINVPGQGYLFAAPVSGDKLDKETGYQAASEPAQYGALPKLPRSIVGRDEIVGRLTSMLTSRRFVTLVGTGGIGKTTVAIAVANSLVSACKMGVFFINLQAITNGADVSSFIASSVGCFIQGSDPEQSLRTFLSGRETCLILDNCEHVIEIAAPLAQRLLDGVQSLSILATSREALRVRGENILLLPPLGLPEDGPMTASKALASPAVQLFMERAATGGFAGRLTDIDAPLVVDICRRLDGIALAIELAASRVGFYGIRGTLELLNEGSGLQLLGTRTTSSRHQTLESLLDWSVKLLAPHERTILFELAIFGSDFTLEDADAVVGKDGAHADVRAAIASLVEKSLVQNSSDLQMAKYRILGVTRAYAMERLETTGFKGRLAERLANHLRDFLTRLQGPQAADCCDELCAYHIGNIQIVLPWCFSEEGDKVLGIEIAGKATRLFMAKSHFALCHHWCREALNALRSEHEGTAFHLSLLEALARSSIYVNGGRETRVLIQNALDLARTRRDDKCQLNLLADLNVFLTRQGEFSAALDAAEQSFAVAKKIQGRSETILAEWMLAASYHLAGDQYAAIQHAEIGQALARIEPPVKLDLFQEARVRFALARSLWLHGYPDRALAAARLAVAESAKNPEHVSYCLSLIYATPVFLWSGKYDEASPYIEMAITQATKQGLSAFRSLGQALAGELLVLTGKPYLGVEVLREAIDGMQANRNDIVVSTTSAVLANALAACSRWNDAHAVVDAAIYAAERRAEKIWMPDLLMAKAGILLRQVNPAIPQAEALLMRTMVLAEQQSALSWQLRAAIPLARSWTVAGKRSQAIELLTVLLSRFTEGFETSDLVCARMMLASLQTIKATA